MLALLAAACVPALRGVEQARGDGSRIIRNAGDFWDLTDAEKQRPHRIRLELVVYFYDPGWKLLWGECNGVGCYYNCRGEPLPLKVGQRVRIEGTVVPAAGLSGSGVSITVLAQDALPRPLSTTGRLSDGGRFDAQWVESEGYVCAQREVDASHLELSVLSDGRLVRATLLLGETDPIPQLVNTRIRFDYVYMPSRDPLGDVRMVNGWIPGPRHVAMLGSMETDPLFDRPVTPIDGIGGSQPEDSVHIVGEIKAVEAGQSVTVRDASGQVVVRTEQPLAAGIGDYLEVTGNPTGRGLDVTLSNPVCRLLRRGRAAPATQDAGSQQPLKKFRLADQIMELRPEDASRHFPAALRGVVTWSDPQAGFFFLQDSSGGVRVRCDGGSEPPPSGTISAVAGITSQGVFAPEVDAKTINVITKSACPPGHPVTLEEALTGSEEAQRVEMRGYLRAVERSGPWMQLDLTTSTGEFIAAIANNDVVAGLVGSIIRVTGVCTAMTKGTREVVGVRVWLADPDGVEVEQPRPADPFSAPYRTIAGLRQFLSYRVLERQVRLTGIVLYDQPGRFLYLQQQDAGVLVLHRDSVPLNPGEWIEVVGLPGRDGNRLVVREAMWRRTHPAVAPTPLELADPSVLLPGVDGRLVRVRGRCQDKISDDGSRRLIIRSVGTQFEAHLDKTVTGVLPRDGSVVELTGVYSIQYDEYRHPRAFRLLLRSLADVTVVESPSWWTTSRALTIAAALGICAMLGVAWVVVLRRRVQNQTAQIRAQLEKEAQLSADLERSARLESLGVLAGGIAHDFNNLLTVIIANLGLAIMDDRVRNAAGDILADAERGARRAAELTQQLLTFAKGGDPVRRAVALPDVVREAANFARHGSRVRCDFAIEPNLPPADVDRGQISRVVHNLVLNATQAMSDGGVIVIGLSLVQVDGDGEGALGAGDYVRLSVSDNGPGIAPPHLERIFEPYFSTKPKNNGLGLATVHSIVKKHQGQIRVKSELGRGTTFLIWLPVAKQPADPIHPVASVAAETAGLRVLFMDDEDVIRRAAAAVLRQLGCDAVLVADGSEVVREYERGLRSGRKFDAVVVDLTVPGGMGGREAVDVLRKMDPGVRAVVSSGYSNDPVLANYRAYGFQAVVPKPYEIEDLARAIRQVTCQSAEESAKAVA